MNGCTITDEYKRRGIPTVLLENEYLRIEVLTGKGGDITELRDKRTDVNLLFESPHNWRAPRDGYVGSPDEIFSFLDYYPGGWQCVIPGAGGPTSNHGASLGLHGETSLTPWNATITKDGPEEVTVLLTVDLTRYPFVIERELSLVTGRPELRVETSVVNQGEVELDYSWLEHLTFGPPLIGPEAKLDVPCKTVLTDPNNVDDNAVLPPDEKFEWPIPDLSDNSTVDLREFPAKSERVHDDLALTDLVEGRFTVTNPSLELAVTVQFPSSVFEYLWYWRALGGFEKAPFFGRNYTAGLEPCTSFPNQGLERTIENGTAPTLAPGEEQTTILTVNVHEPKDG